MIDIYQSYFIFSHNKETKEWTEDVCVPDVGEGRDGLSTDDFRGPEFRAPRVLMYVIIVVHNPGISKINQL